MVRKILFAVLLAVSIVTPEVSAKEVYIPIAGAVAGGNNAFFLTDARLLNPSFTKDIVVAAFYYQRNRNNSETASINITVPKRQMLVLNDIVRNTFGAADLGAIRFSSTDDFVVTSRTYTASNCSAPAGGTFGQFVPGFDQATDTLTKGAIIQLAYSADTTRGFRANIGFANPNNATATITAKLYDGTNAQIGTATITLQPFDAQILNTAATFAVPTLNTDNAWVSFSSTQPVFAYGSAVDNVSGDQVFIAARADSGVEPPVGPNLVTVNIVARQFSYQINGTAVDAFTVKKGDRVTLKMSTSDNTHGFAMSPYVASITLAPNAPKEVTFDATTEGNFGFFCTISTCGSGHFSMGGTMTVTP